MNNWKDYRWKLKENYGEAHTTRKGVQKEAKKRPQQVCACVVFYEFIQVLIIT
jgi:hypothetical protein